MSGRMERGRRGEGAGPPAPRFGRLRRLVLLLVLVPLLLPIAAFAARPAVGQEMEGDGGEAASRDVFTVFDLKIDERAENAMLARRAGLEKAQAQAYAVLMDKLVAAADRQRLPPPSAPLLARLVAGLDVRDERRGAGHYLATLDVHFRPSAVRALFRDLGVHYSETPAAVHRLLVFGTQAGRLQDEGGEGERWRAAVAAADIRNRLVPLRPVPDGPYRRVLVSRIGASVPISADGVCDGKAASLVVMRFGHLPPFGPRAGHVRLDLRSCGGPELVWHGEREMPAGVPLAGLARELAAASLAALDEAWRQETLIAPDEEDLLLVQVPSRSPEELRQVEEVLHSINLVRGVDVVEIALPESRLAVRFEGRRRLLALALAQRGWRLLVTAQGAWLRPRSSADAGKSAEDGKGGGDDDG